MLNSCPSATAADAGLEATQTGSLRIYMVVTCPSPGGGASKLSTSIGASNAMF